LCSCCYSNFIMIPADGREADTRKLPWFYGQVQVFAHYLVPAVAEGVTVQEARKMGRGDLAERLRVDRLTRFGQALGRVVAGRHVIDLACGHPEQSNAPREISRVLGARRYTGVDIELPQEYADGSAANELADPGINVAYEQTDILSFVEGLEPAAEEARTFYIGGLEPVCTSDSATRRYADACLREMRRVTREGDAVVVGTATHGFDPEYYGFALKEQATTSNKYNDYLISQRLFVRE
jgi:hypothetical protein